MGEWQPYRLSESGSASKLSTINYQLSPATPLAAWLIADMLSDNAARAISFGMQSALRFDFPVACKTGTSSDFRDNWAVGYTPEFTVAVWAGNFDGTPMREVSGVTGAAPIMHAVMDRLHAQFGTSWFPRPAEIVERDVHPVTGKLLAAARADAVREKFVTGQLPPIESAADYDASGKVILGPEYAEWSASAQNGMTARTAVEDRDVPLRVESPLPGTTFLVDPDLPSSERVPLRAKGPGEVTWTSDSLEVREVDGRTFVIAREGEHRITAHDATTGRTVETWIRVKTL